VLIKAAVVNAKTGS